MSDPSNSGDGIPREFHSEYEERPFRSCSRCGESLETFENYQINKAYRNNECVFEYAFCGSCRDALLEEFSDESKTNMMRYQQENMRVTQGIFECAFCSKSQEESPMKDYSITALCCEDHLLDSLMICLTCQEAMHELLSVATKDVRRRFFEDLPGVPPDWETWPQEEEAPPLKSAAPRELATSSMHSGFTHRAKNKKAAFSVKHPSDDGCLELLWEVRPL